MQKPATGLPQVTVLLCVHNGMPFLKDAVNSVLTQTYTDFELLIMDDASTDSTPAWLATLKDNRITILYHKKLRGLTANLIEGVALAKGDYIARLDADDIAVNSRLEIQTTYLDSHPDIQIIGGCHKEFFTVPPRPMPTAPDTISATLISFDALVEQNQFTHSSVMFRKAMIPQKINYRLQFNLCQDYDLWLRAALVAPLAKLKQTVVYYRRSNTALSLKHAYEQWTRGEQARVLAKERRLTSTDALERGEPLPKMSNKQRRMLHYETSETFLYWFQRMWKTGSKTNALTLLTKACWMSPVNCIFRLTAFVLRKR